MEKKEVLARLEECGVIAVVRGNSEAQAIKIVDACIAGGIIGIEITYTVPQATEIISMLAKKYKSEEVLIGAGTVMDAQTCRNAILAGANYIVSPCLDEETVKMCLCYQIACIQGAMTVKEGVDCIKAGADIIKIFPAGLFGPSIIKNFKGPLPHAKMMPTGGVNVHNIKDWIGAGAVAVGAGSDLTAGAKTEDYASIERLAGQMVSEVKNARLNNGRKV